MVISEIRVYAHQLPVAGSYTMSSSAVRAPKSTIVEVETADGLIGYGEVCLATPIYQAAHNDGVRTSLGVLAPELIGADPTRLRLIHQTMNATLGGNHEAKAAIDIACWDLAAKSLGLRLCDLLGGALADPVATYHVVQIATAEEAAESADDLQAQGITKLQLKAGGRDIAADIGSIRAVGAVLRPGTELAVDANRGWTTAEAQQVSQACRDVRMAIEQPCSTYDECIGVRPQLVHPMLLDEPMTDVATVVRAAASGLVDGFGMKVSRIGGISRMLAVRDICEAARLPFSTDDAWGGDIIGAACAHVGATVDPRLHRGSWLAQPYIGEHYDSTNGPRIADGTVALPAGGPGLGLTIEPGYFGDPHATYSSRKDNAGV